MRRVSWRVLVLTVALLASLDARGLAQQAPVAKPEAPPATRPPVNPPDLARMKQVLIGWEKQSAQLKSLDVSISRLDRSPAWGDDQYEGRAILMSPNYAWLDFQKVTQDSQKGKKLIPHERIICTGVEVWQYRSDTRQIFIFPLEKQAQQRALEEGPLPFLFNMKAAEAEARYLMSLVNETPEYFVISVVPKLKIDLESFSKAFLKLNKKTFLPDRIFLVSPDGRSTKDFTLTSVRPNAPVATANFKGQVLGKPWTVVRNPDAAGNPNGAPARDASTTPTAPRQQPAAGLGARQPSVAPAAAPRRR